MNQSTRILHRLVQLIQSRQVIQQYKVVIEILETIENLDEKVFRKHTHAINFGIRYYDEYFGDEYEDADYRYSIAEALLFCIATSYKDEYEQRSNLVEYIMARTSSISTIASSEILAFLMPYAIFHKQDLVLAILKKMGNLDEKVFKKTEHGFEFSERAGNYSIAEALLFSFGKMISLRLIGDVSRVPLVDYIMKTNSRIDSQVLTDLSLVKNEITESVSKATESLLKAKEELDNFQQSEHMLQDYMYKLTGSRLTKSGFGQKAFDWVMSPNRTNFRKRMYEEDMNDVFGNDAITKRPRKGGKRRKPKTAAFNKSGTKKRALKAGS